MRKTDIVVQGLLSDIQGKDILEMACGAAEFSCAASVYARSVFCIDLDDRRAPFAKRGNIYFGMMDAAKMTYPDEAFDTIFLYNALFHVQSQWEQIQKECKRVLKPEGSICIVATWKMDIALMQELFGDKTEENYGFWIVRLKK